MQLIVGLGNPGKKYENTLHNAGFQCVDKFAAKHGFEWQISKKFQAEIAENTVEGQSIKLLKPLTYMNLSGESVSAYMRYFDITASDLIVIYDEADLPIGKIRIRKDGRSAGHRGLQSIIDCIGTEDFTRIRVGISPGSERKNVNLKNFVLTKLSGNIKDLLHQLTDEVPEIIEKIIFSGVDTAMNKYNGISYIEFEEK